MSLIRLRAQLFFRWLFCPSLCFFVQLPLAVVLGLAPDLGAAAALCALIAPWLGILALVLNLPLLCAAGSLGRVTESHKRNHALEHATIHYLRERHGSTLRLSGRAMADGFRVAGARCRKDVQRAFDQLREALGRGQPLPVVSPHCGSNLVTAQALALLLPLATAALLLVARPLGFLLLAADVPAFLLLRERIGNEIQRRYFLSTELAGADAVSIDKVPRRIGWERGPVFFARTRIASGSDSAFTAPGGSLGGSGDRHHQGPEHEDQARDVRPQQ